jgi:hypothetical protein
LKLHSECLLQFQNTTLTGCKIVSNDTSTDKRPLTTYRMYPTTRWLLAYAFNFTQKFFLTGEKGTENCHEMGGREDATIFVSIVQAYV